MTRPMNSGEKTASAMYRSVADQLAKGTAPEAIEAHLIHQGLDEDTARLLVTEVLDEMPATLRARYTWQMYSSLGMFGVALLMALGISFLSLLGAPIAFKGILRTWVAALLWMIGSGYWIVVSIWKIRLAQRLDGVRRAWLRGGDRRPVPQPEGIAKKSPHLAGVSRRPPADDSSGLVRSAIDARESERLRWMGWLVGGSVLLLLVCSGCVVVPGLIALSRFGHQSDESSSSVSAPKEEVGPNAPDPNEGPPPRGWVVLFRSDDPTIWNTDSPGKNFALPVRRAHSKIRYLRLKRLDTGEMLIVPITHRQLTLDERTDSFPGHWWNGTARQEWGARHLGIAQVPSSGGYETGLIGVTHDSDRVYSGSGFGWKIRVDDRQYYCWQGKEIPRTAFEVAVTADPLTEEERRWFTGPGAQDDPPPADWTILFRANDPSVWNTFSTGEQFAVPVSRAHAAIRYLRLTRQDTGDALILPITHKQLAREDRPNPARGYWWNGSGAVEYNSRHLGIVQIPPAPARVRGLIGVTGDGFNAFVGSGFGGKCLVDDGTCCCWRGQEIPKTIFEIAVTTAPLTEDEKRWLVE